MKMALDAKIMGQLEELLPEATRQGRRWTHSCCGGWPVL